MKSYVKKFLKCIIISFLVMNTMTFATTGVGTAVSTLTNPQISEPTEVKEIASRILGAAQYITIFGGIIVIAAIGIKYMLGSVDEKAITKKSMVPLVIGITIAMGATTFARIIYNVFAG